jgi:hypothetical protein
MSKQKRSQSAEVRAAGGWRLVRLLALSLVLAVGMFGVRTWAQWADQIASRENFDIRSAKSTAADAFMQRFQARDSFAAVSDLLDQQKSGLARLQADFPALDVVQSPELRTAEVIGSQPGHGFLTGPSTDRAAAMRGFIASYASAYGLTAAQAQGLVLVADYENPAGNMAWVEFEQRLNGLPVFRGLIRGGFTAKGELARTTGALAAGIDETTLSVSPLLTAAGAISAAANNVGWKVPESALAQKEAAASGIITFDRGPMAADAKAWLLYFPLAPGVARLAWATEIWGDPDAFLILVDAEDGTVLFRKNMTEYQTQTASYGVYLDDSPAPMSPSTTLPGSGTQAPFIGRTFVTLIGNEAPNTFNNLGWMTDGTNITDGNNVQAGIDRDGINGVDAPITGSPNRVFSFVYNPQTDEPLTALYQAGEVSDAFYWANVYHDRLYLLGFTEAARNFQNDNFGRGGVAADRVSAEEQDSSGTNNANFSTPADGGRGRMQMYIFPSAAPDRTSGLDHDVLLHELTHGTSNRLHSNASGLTSTFARSMGEGWSDFYARSLLSSAAENVNGIYSTGGWVTYLLGGLTDNYYYGIRRFPYAVITTVGANGRPHNPLTFADVDGAQINVANGAYPNSPIISATPAFEVHNAGEVWAMALLEVRARFINRLGYATGNQRILQWVTDGMKLDPANPTFLNGRDSILAAASAGGATIADLTDIWSGFAARGMGYSAQVLNAGTGSVVEAFDLPGISAGASSLVTESIPNGRLDPGEVVDVSLCVVNAGFATSGTVTGTLLATGGVTSPSAPQSYGALPASGNACRTYTFTVSSTCGSVVTATLQAAESGGSTRNLNYFFQVGTPSIFFTELFDGVAAPALPAGWTSVPVSGGANAFATNTTTPDTAPNRAFAANPGVVTDNALTSPVIALPAGISVMQFRNHFNTESGYDGGVLEISIGGGAFQDIVTAGGVFYSGGYNAVISACCSNPLANRQAWSGDSGGYITTVLKLPPSAASQNIRLRWRLGTDDSVAATGWAVDTFAVYTYTCSAVSPPGAFGKTAPANGASGQSLGPTLSWGASSGATSYEYCVDTSNNGACDVSWVSVGSSTSAVLSGLAPTRTYSWQVRAVNAGGATQADAGTFWTFSTQNITNPLTDLAIDFGAGYGLWSYYDNGASWLQLHGFSPSLLRSGDLDGNGLADLVVNFPGYGVWAFMNNSSWSQLHSFDAADIRTGDLDGNGKDDVAISFPGYGIYVRYDSGAWSQVHPLNPNHMIIGNIDGSAGGRADLIVNFPTYGVYALRNNTSWVQVHSYQADDLQVGDLDGNGVGDLIVQFPSLGEWILYNSTSWAQLHPLAAAGFTTGNIDGDAGGKSDVVVNFPGYGVYAFLNNATWVQLHSLNAPIMATGDIDGNGQADVILHFPGFGVWTYKNLTTWTQIHSLTPDGFAGGRMNAN